MIIWAVPARYRAHSALYVARCALAVLTASVLGFGIGYTELYSERESLRRETQERRSREEQERLAEIGRKGVRSVPFVYASASSCHTDHQVVGTAWQCTSHTARCPLPLAQAARTNQELLELQAARQGGGAGACVH